MINHFNIPDPSITAGCQFVDSSIRVGGLWNYLPSVIVKILCYYLTHAHKFMGLYVELYTDYGPAYYGFILHLTLIFNFIT